MLGGDGEEAAGERRVKIRRYEQAAAHFLNPNGISPMHECTLGALWKSVCAGTKQVQALADIAIADPYRRGVGISRFAQSMLCLDKAFESEHFRAVIKKEVFDKAKAEYLTLKPHLTLLDGGFADTKRQIRCGAPSRQKRRRSQSMKCELQLPVCSIG